MNRALHVINLAAFLIGLLAIVVVLNFFARQEPWRARIDATKTRAYSLTEQTQQLLQNLQGQWKIAIIMDQARADRGMRRQIDEVLSRYTGAAGNIKVVRIDPADPRTLIEYDALLAELHSIYKDDIAQYDRALDAGVQAFNTLQAFAQQQGGQLDAITNMLPANDPMRDTLRQRVGSLSLLADQGTQILEAIEKARRVDESRPLPDFDTARSTLVAALAQSAGDLDELAAALGRWAQQPNVEGAAQEFIQAAQSQSRAMSQHLAEIADPLKHLPPLELSSIGTQLQQGEAAIVLSPNRAAIIPSSQLFPKTNLRRADDGRTLFDQRFRGEQLISATIRSLTLQHMPLVVFVHAEDDSLLKHRDRQADLVGAASLLKASRFETAEWQMSKSAPRPTGAKGQPVVWVVVPPPPARSMEPTQAVLSLVDATSKLIAEGEAVLLSVSPSMVARYGRTDSFALMARDFGLEAVTAQIVLESSTTGGDSQLSFGQAIHEYSPEHLIGRAVDGQQTYFGMPVPLRMVQSSAGDVQHHVIASIMPSTNRWLENEWTGDLTRRDPSERKALQDEVPIVIAAERPHPAGRGTAKQRLMLCGSGGWMVSNVADVVVDISGGAGRVALINPGNHELMLASVAWLAGMDDLIAASPISQEIARLRDVTPEVRARWMWIVLGGLPGACVLLGVVMWMIRRK